jgi:1,5-anhydro-D-fructose reductase (1,5-anhydro-D-mannitol-forming)
MIRVGIIGFGKMGRIRANAVKNIKTYHIVSVYDPKLADSSKYSKSKSADHIIKNKDIDAVFICTPNYLNKPLTIRALQAGKHVFCEKPPAFTVKEVKEIQKVERKTGKKLMYGFNHRHHGSIKKIKSIIDSREYGQILWMRGRYGKSVDSSFYDNWRSKKKLSGGGILLDQGIHMLDLFLYLAGNFDEVQAFTSNLYWKLEGIEDNVFALFRNNKTGVVASLHSTMTQWRHLFALEIFLEKGYAVLNGLKTSSGTYGKEVLSIAKNRTTAPAATWKDEERAVFSANDSWQKELEHFYGAISHDRPVEIGNSEDALRVMQMIDRVYSFKLKVSKKRHNKL